jgi:hypothetical protein
MAAAGTVLLANAGVYLHTTLRGKLRIWERELTTIASVVSTKCRARRHVAGGKLANTAMELLRSEFPVNDGPQLSATATYTGAPGQ